MTDADRARIARQWGVPIDSIPAARVIPRGVSGLQPPASWRDTNRAIAKSARLRRMRALREREQRGQA